ncbi:MAG: hypothetical protein ACHQ1D_00190 [Nitrososphaerales archaeon]
MPQSLLKIIAEKNQRIEDIPLEFQSSVEKLQRRIFNKVIDLIGQLDTEGGSIKMTEANLLRVEMINSELKQVLNGKEYTGAVREFVSEFEVQKNVNDKYFKQAFKSEFNQVGIANQLVKNSQRNAFELLAGAPAEQNFITPIKSQLEHAVSSGASFKDTIKGIRELVEGSDEVDGRLLRYSKQVSWDSFALSDRAYTNAVADDLELEWFRYSGGIVRDSRCFCDERNGNYYHFKEIEAWGRMQDLGECNIGGGWAGMMQGTNESTIFIVAGGYNCKHSIMPVSLGLVPRDVIDRNIANGNFEPTQFEIDEFGL